MGKQVAKLHDRIHDDYDMLNLNVTKSDYILLTCICMQSEIKTADAQSRAVNDHSSRNMVTLGVK